MIREPYNLNPYNSTIDTSKVNNFSFTFSGDELGSWNIEIAKNNTSPEIVYTSEEFVPEDVGYTHIYDGDIVEGITLPSTIAHSQGDDGLLRRLYSINGYPFDEAVVKLNVNGIENIGNIKGSTTNGYLVATNYSLGRTGDGVTIIGFDKDGTTIGSQVADGTYDFLGYLLSVKANSNIQVGQVVQIEGNSFIIGSIEDIGDGYSELTIVNGEATISDAASIASFESLTEAEVTELTVGIEPVQDLNGYDAPWVGGAGKNLLDASSAEIGIAWNGSSNAARARLVIPCKPSTQYTLSINGTNNLESIYSNDGASVPLSSAGASFTNTKTFTTTSTSNYIVVGFNKTSITQADIDALKLQLELGSAATAWQPYSNICPITGHDEVEVTRTGKNLLDNTVKSGQTLTSNGVSCTINSDGSVAVSGTATAGPINAWFVGGYGIGFKVKRLPAGTYTFTDFLPFYHYVDETNLSSVPTSFSSRSITFTFTKEWWLDGVRCPAAEKGNEYNLTLYPQMELGSTATAYEPYQGSTYTTSLGQTVYGGTLDMVSGVLTVDRAIVTLNGSETWYTWRQAYFTNVGNLVGGAGYPVEMMSNSFRWIGRHNVPPSNVELGDFLGNAASVGSNWNGNVSFFYDNLVGGLDNFKAWVASNPIQIVYTLNTPHTYTLTPQQIKTLVGTNNVWASSGDIVSITFKYNIN